MGRQPSANDRRLQVLRRIVFNSKHGARASAYRGSRLPYRTANGKRERRSLSHWRSGELGAPGRNRTCDPALRRGVLYPLSYGGRCSSILSRRFEPAVLVPLELGEFARLRCRGGRS